MTNKSKQDSSSETSLMDPQWARFSNLISFSFIGMVELIYACIVLVFPPETITLPFVYLTSGTSIMFICCILYYFTSFISNIGILQDVSPRIYKILHSVCLVTTAVSALILVICGVLVFTKEENMNSIIFITFIACVFTRCISLTSLTFVELKLILSVH